MENQSLEFVLKGQELAKDINTGLTQFGQKFITQSGFEINNGYRSFENLVILESIAKGVGISFLNSIKIFDKNQKLIIDKTLEKNTRYERKLVVAIVKNCLLNLLKEASKNNADFDINKAESMIQEKLENAYFKESYDAILDWFNDLTKS